MPTADQPSFRPPTSTSYRGHVHLYAEDGNGVGAAPATVSININPVNDAPTPTNDT